MRMAIIAAAQADLRLCHRIEAAPVDVPWEAVSTKFSFAENIKMRCRPAELDGLGRLCLCTLAKHISLVLCSWRPFSHDSFCSFVSVAAKFVPCSSSCSLTTLPALYSFMSSHFGLVFRHSYVPETCTWHIGGCYAAATGISQGQALRLHECMPSFPSVFVGLNKDPRLSLPSPLS